jgi:hypothetical protein
MSGTNHIDWKTYESITRYIYENLGRHADVVVKGYGRDCKVTGQSGVQHQIDVLTTHYDGIRSYDTAIECKYWNKKVNKDVVMKLSSIMEDAGISKGIIVTRNGFTKDGEDYAKFKNIGLVVLREWNERDRDSRPKEIELGILQIKLNIISTSPKLLQIDLGNNRFLSVEDEFDLFNYYLELKDKKIVPFYNYIKDFRLYIADQEKMDLEMNKTYRFPESRLYRRGITEGIEIDEMTIKGKLTRSDKSKNLEFRLVDKVWLIMRSIFDNRTFSFSENGILIEHSNDSS